MKKSVVLAAAAIVFGGILASATPAMARPPVAPVVTVSATAIDNGGALTISVNAQTVQPGYCVVFSVQGTADAIVYAPGDSLQTWTMAAGTGGYFNTNLTPAVMTNTADVYSVATDCSSPRTLVSTVAWTVAPRLVVATPADFTVGMPVDEEVSFTLNDRLTGQYSFIPLAEGAHWEVVPGNLCEAALGISGVAAPSFVALPAGITVDPTVSAADTTPMLRFAGTATADEVGSYNLCLNLVGSNANSFNIGYATTTLSIMPALAATAAIDPAAVVVPALANTGLDSSGLLAGGAGAAALGLAMIALLRRRKATV